ncbi:MAG: vWA domain-containing protein, partial [Candidatus Eremiobacterota bacterium]
MTNAIIVMDISGSMKEYVRGTNKSKFAILKEKLITILSDNNHRLTFDLCFFNDRLIKYGSYNEPSDVVKALNTMNLNFNGGTKIWDCLKDVIENITSKDKTLILCFTDGEDSGSRETLEGIISTIKTKEKTELTIIDITGNLAENIKRKNTLIPEEIVRINDVKQSFEHLEIEL